MNLDHILKFFGGAEPTADELRDIVNETVLLVLATKTSHSGLRLSGCAVSIRRISYPVRLSETDCQERWPVLQVSWTPLPVEVAVRSTGRGGLGMVTSTTFEYPDSL